MKGRLKVILTLTLSLIATISLGLCALVVSANTVDLSSYESLVFQHAYMGGQDRTVFGAPNPTTTAWGGALALTFSTNANDIKGKGCPDYSGGYLYNSNIENENSVISDGKGGYLKNKDLVVYNAKSNGITGISSIWFDTQSNLVFEPNDPYKESNISILKDKDNSNIPYFDYKDGDEIIVKKGFTLTVHDKTGATVKKVLKEDVTARFNELEFTWNIISTGAGNNTLAKANEVTAKPANATTAWGVQVSLFGDSRPSYSTGTGDYDLKALVRTENENGSKMFYMNTPFVEYYNSNGTKLPVTEIYYTTDGIVIRGNNQALASAGDSILLKKGFREGLYSGPLGGGNVAGTTNGVFETIKVLGEDVVFRFNGTAWERITSVNEFADISFANYLDNNSGSTSLYFGQQIQLGFNIPVAEKVTFRSGDPSVATVSENGVVTAVINKEITDMSKAKGTYIYAIFESGKEIAHYFINVGQGAILDNEGEANVTASNFNKIVLYRDAYGNVDTSLEAKAEIAGQITFRGKLGNFGNEKTVIRLSAENVTSITANNVTITYNNFTKTFSAELFDRPKSASFVKENVLSWNNYLALSLAQSTADTNYKEPFIDVEVLDKLGQLDKVTLRSAKAIGEEYHPNRVKYIYGYQIVPMFVGKNSLTVTKGDVLEIKKGLKIYRLENDAPVAVQQIDNDITLVYNGNNWQPLTVEATDIELDKTSITLPVGAYYEVGYTVKPAGSYAVAKLTSADSSKIEVSEDGRFIKVKQSFSGTVNVTVSLGEKEYTLAVTCGNSEVVVGYKIFTENLNYTVSHKQDLDFSYYANGIDKKQIQAVPMFESGVSGVPFDITTANTTVSGYDKNKTGVQKVTLTITNNGLTYDIENFSVTVKENRDQMVDLILQDPYVKNKEDANYMPTLFIDFAAFAGNVNIPRAITEGVYNISSYVQYKRGGTYYSVVTDINAEHLVARPNIPYNSVESFKVGDQLLIKKGMPLIAWTGTSASYATSGNGNWVKVGTVVCDIIIECSNANVQNAAWETIVEYTDLVLKSEVITLPLSNVPQSTGVSIAPSYATTGEIIYESLDPNVAYINANNQIVTKAIGTAEIKVTLKRMDKLSNIGDTSLQPITKIITVVVEEAPTGVKLGDTPLDFRVGTIITGEDLVRRGVQATFIWADGSMHGNVDLSTAVIDEDTYMKSVEGTYEVTVYVEYYGLYFIDTLTINIVPADAIIDEGPIAQDPNFGEVNFWTDDEDGCIGSLTGSFDAVIIAFVLASAVITVTAIKKKAKKQ